MYFLFVNKTLRLNNLKTKTDVNAKISVFVICVAAIIYLLLYNLHDCTFNYCSLIWMFHSRIINSKMNRLHERCLHLLCRDKSSSFEKLLEQGKSVTILATEMFKVYRNIFPLIFSEISHQHDINYNLRIISDFAMPNVRSAFHGSELSI